MIAPEFSCTADMLAHYAAVQHRLRHVPVKPMREIPANPQPLIEAPTEPQRVDWRTIAQSIADAHGVAMKEIIGDCRAKRIQPARQELYYRMVVERGLSLNEAARLLNRDHTSILYGLRRHMDRCSEARGGYDAHKAELAEKRRVRDIEVWRRYQGGESLNTISLECRIAPAYIAPTAARVDAEQRAERLKAWAAQA